MISQKVEFENREAQRLSGILDLPEGPVSAFALFAHCFTCSKTSLAASRIARALAALRIGVLRFDFTGLGESDGDFSQTGFSSNVSDLVDAAAWMTGQGRAPALLIGHSLGGAAALVAAQQIPQVKAVATLAAPSDAEHVTAQFQEHLPQIAEHGQAQVELADRPFVIRQSFVDDLQGAKVLEAAAHLRRPLLILHAPTDDTVGIENATALFVAAKHPKSFVSLDHADHLLSDRGDAAYAAQVIAAWATRYIGEIEAVDAGGMLPEGTVRVRETRDGGRYQNEVHIEGKRYLADEPVRVGGEGSGPAPYDWLMAGLGACTSMTLRMYAERKDWPLERVSVSVSHEKRAAPDRPGGKVDVFTRELTVAGDLDEAQRARLLEIADRCPVHRTLEHSSLIETQLVTLSAK